MVTLHSHRFSAKLSGIMSILLLAIILLSGEADHTPKSPWWRSVHAGLADAELSQDLEDKSQDDAIEDNILDTIEFGDWKAQIRVQHGDEDMRILEIFRNGTLVESLNDYRLYFTGHYEEDSDLAMASAGIDLTGNGLPKLLVQAYSGGMHCCYYYYLLELGERVRILDEISTTHSAISKVVDEDENGRFELHFRDATFAYWRTCYAMSPMPDVVLEWETGGFKVARHFMARPAPPDEELDRMADCIRWSWAAGKRLDDDYERWEQETDAANEGGMDDFSGEVSSGNVIEEEIPDRRTSETLTDSTVTAKAISPPSAEDGITTAGFFAVTKEDPVATLTLAVAAAGNSLPDADTASTDPAEPKEYEHPLDWENRIQSARCLDEDNYFHPELLWAIMLDLIYTGHEDKAWRFFDRAHPNNRHKDAFLEDFLYVLYESPFCPIPARPLPENIAETDSKNPSPLRSL